MTQHRQEFVFRNAGFFDPVSLGHQLAMTQAIFESDRYAVREFLGQHQSGRSVMIFGFSDQKSHSPHNPILTTKGHKDRGLHTALFDFGIQF